MKAIRVHDARGKRVPLCRPGALKGPAVQQAKAALAATDSRIILTAAVFLSVSVASFAVMYTSLRPLMRTGHGLPDTTLAALVAGSIASIALAAIASRWQLGRRRGATAVAACVAVRRCPSCAYDLSALAAQQDGCIVCPECGAAWRVSTQHTEPMP